jgi:preprotein translocase subunit SecG
MAQPLEVLHMQTVIVIVHLIIVLALIGVVLLQRSEGGGLGLGGGGGGGVSGFMTGRGQANALTRTTAILGGLFFITSIALALFANFGRAPRSIFDGAAPAGQQAPANGQGQGPGVLEQLQRMQGDQPAAPPAGGAPAAPAAPSIPFQAPAAPGGAPQVPQSQ